MAEVVTLLVVGVFMLALGVGAWLMERPGRTSEDWGYKSEGRWR